MPESRADLHVHSKYSDRPSEWILRRVGAPECYTPPKTVYETARRRGMQFVTISDHNCIQGALEIAHLPNAFISNEVTAYFPTDDCKVHVLCWNITEAQFAEIQVLRENIVELRDYFVAEGIVHACAHPLYSVNDRLSIEHFEQLLLLFNVFETMNGGRNRRGNDLVLGIVNGLTRDAFERIANTYPVSPVGERPWVKGATGGSDDHSGTFVAKGFTECPASRTPAEFLTHVFEHRSHAGGLDGTPLSFAHSLYSIGYQYYRDRFLSKSTGGSDLIVKVISEVFGRAQPPAPFRDRMSHYVRRIGRGPERSAEIEFRRTISAEMLSLFGEDWLKDDFVASADRYEELNRRTFELSSKVANQLLFQFAKQFVEKLSAGSVFGSLEALSAAGPILLGVAPYLFSFAHQSRDKVFLADVSERFLGRRSLAGAQTAGGKRAWFTDTLTDVNGVTTLIRKMCQLADVHEHDLTLVSVADTPPEYPGRVRNFAPVGQFVVPEHEAVKLAWPPFLDILEYCDREQFTDLIVSTPGLAGLAAVAAAKILKIRLVGIYHTDLPLYIRYYTDDEAMEGAAWRYLRWFYEQMDLVFVPSRAYQRQLVAKGFDPAKLRLFPHGTDIQAFHPNHRDESFWRGVTAARGPVVTYVGRVAKEKDIDVLIDVYDALAKRRPDCVLAVVGDGPLLAEMKNRLRQPNVVFTGFLFGEALSQAYASSDVFVFPSTTDTFGSVVLEAMASGVPVIVSDRGGAQELVDPGRTGLVTKGRDVASLLAGIESLLDRPDLRRDMALACRAHAETWQWENAYATFWSRIEGSGVHGPEAPSAVTLASYSSDKVLSRGRLLPQNVL
jgi:glycosyltransferase involved in cell wall biosynthesis